MEVTKTSKQILNDAADWLEAHDWCQGSYRQGPDYNVPDRCCVVGVIGLMTEGPPSLQVAAHDLVRPHIGPHKDLICWNDSADTDKCDVIRALRLAAK